MSRVSAQPGKLKSQSLCQSRTQFLSRQSVLAWTSARHRNESQISQTRAINCTKASSGESSYSQTSSALYSPCNKISFTLPATPKIVKQSAEMAWAPNFSYKVMDKNLLRRLRLRWTRGPGVTNSLVHWAQPTGQASQGRQKGPHVRV